MRKKVIISTVILALLVSNIIMAVFAQGPFDRTCPRCNGKGYITNQTAVNIAIASVVVVIGSVVAVTGYAISRRKKKQT